MIPNGRDPHDPWPAQFAAAVLMLLGFFPWAAFLPVGLEIPGLGAQLLDWLTGSVLTLGVATLAWLASRRGHWPATAVPPAAPALTPPASTPPAGSPTASPAAQSAPASRPHWRAPGAVYLVALGALLLYAVVATTVFSRRPLLIDEIVQLWQAQRYAEGHLWLPVPAFREFFSFLHVVDVADRVYAQFPPGGPFMLWLGVLAGAPWLVGPVCGALSVWLFALMARAAEPHASARWVAGATALFAVTPFAVFQFSSHMNHGTALLWILVAVVALAQLTGEDAPRRPWIAALVLGLGLGAAATIRPLDAFAFALPAAVWLVVRAGRHPRRWVENVVAGVGVAIPFALMMYVNLQTTRHPLLFGYEVLWGASHGLGFHQAPWGDPHTPLRGFVLASLYQWRLQSYLFETPFPSLLLPLVSLVTWRRVRPFDRYLLAASGLIILFYLLYWHDGNYLGPRFVVPLLPALVLWTARLPFVIRARVESVHLRRAVTAALGFGVVGALVFHLPVRIARYGAEYTSMRPDYAAVAEAAGVRNALVFVRESWGTQLVARLWALGVSRPMAEAVYRGTDTCHLEEAVSSFEQTGVRGADAEQRLAVLLAQDSLYVVKSTMSPDRTEHVRPGARYTAKCLRRIDEDWAGFMHYAPLQLVTSGGNVYARDLHARDSLLMAQYPSRPVYLLKHVGIRIDAPPQFVPLSRDSLLAAWRASR